MKDVIVIRYESWMNYCHFIGLGVFLYTFFSIATGDAIMSSPYGLLLAVASAEVFVTSMARARFRFIHLSAMVEKGVDLRTQPVTFR